MSDGDQPKRSGESCPVCGQHTLQLLYFPDVGATGARPYDELFGLGDIKPDAPPGIGCASCGSEWASLDDFRAGRLREASADADADAEPGEDADQEPGEDPRQDPEHDEARPGRV